MSNCNSSSCTHNWERWYICSECKNPCSTNWGFCKKCGNTAAQIEKIGQMQSCTQLIAAGGFFRSAKYRDTTKIVFKDGTEYIFPPTEWQPSDYYY